MDDGAKHWVEVDDGAKHWVEVDDGAKHWGEKDDIAKHWEEEDDGAKHWGEEDDFTLEFIQSEGKYDGNTANWQRNMVLVNKKSAENIVKIRGNP